nr:hypothetical protein 29 [Candidatus Omnitrophota bacterium]
MLSRQQIEKLDSREICRYTAEDILECRYDRGILIQDEPYGYITTGWCPVADINDAISIIKEMGKLEGFSLGYNGAFWVAGWPGREYTDKFPAAAVCKAAIAEHEATRKEASNV